MLEGTLRVLVQRFHLTTEYKVALLFSKEDVPD